jgi:hypothetical protein
MYVQATQINYAMFVKFYSVGPWFVVESISVAPKNSVGTSETEDKKVIAKTANHLTSTLE